MHTLEVSKRTSGKANALRRQGIVPGVVYGPAMDSQPISMTRRDLQGLFAKITRSSQINLRITGDGKPQEMDVFLKVVDYDSITDIPVHVDFYHPDTTHPLKLNVPVKIVGEAPGTKLGGILNVQFNTIPVHGMPADIPPLLAIDVSSLNIGDSIHVHEIDFGKVEPMLPAERVLVTVIQPRALVAEATAGEGAEVAEGEEGEAAEATEETAAEES